MGGPDNAGDFVLDEFVKDYLTECREGLTQVEVGLLTLEREPDSKHVLANIFRAVHSIKGASGFLGFTRMAEISHEGEELLGLLREGEIRSGAETVGVLLDLVDAMRSMIEAIEADRSEGSRDNNSLITRLRAIAHPDRISSASIATDSVCVESGLPPRSPNPEISDSPDTHRGLSQPAGDPTIRVDVGLLDNLMNLVGELVLTRNQLLRGAIVGDESRVAASIQRLDQVTTGLQEGMLRTRMQPIRVLSSKLPRVVRDLALACGKRAKIVMEGEQTELDKSLSEAIKDPITHIIRNAVDHGIEPPEIRLARGKPEEGTIRLRAHHEGGMVQVEVSDDGAGIDLERLRVKGIERGWIAESEGQEWTDRELIGLIFRPGFSTADVATLVSGRGVGMDVVKSQVESIGGSVDASSRIGEGTVIRMTIPLTLTIINALIIEAGGDRFAIPQINLVELLRLEGEATRSNILEIRGARVVRHRGRLLPLLTLNEVLELGGPELSRDDRPVNIVVLQAEWQRFGIVVNRIDDAQEIVVRPLAKQLKGISCLAGATIMGDGRIALILDAFGLARGLREVHEPEANEKLAIPDGSTDPEDSLETLVILRGTDDGPMALQIDEVVRLETIPRSAVEWVAGRAVVSYRMTLVPLVDVSAWLRGEVGFSASDGDAPQKAWQVVIHEVGGRRIGLVFDRVIDIVRVRLEVRGESTRVGVRLSALIQGTATEVLDVEAIRASFDHRTPTFAGPAR